MPSRARELLVCPNCDAVHRAVVLGRHEVATCVACARVLARHHSLSVDQLLALTVAAALLFLIANSYPLMTIEVGGMHTEATVWGAALLMLHGWAVWPAVVLALSMFILRCCRLVCCFGVLGSARRDAPPGFRGLLVTYIDRGRGA
jgi:paraquat-inducible protein A